MHPDEPIGPPADILLRFSKPPLKLLEKAKPEIESLIEVAEVKKGRLFAYYGVQHNR